MLTVMTIMITIAGITAIGKKKRCADGKVERWFRVFHLWISLFY
jgi:hypothetical protein